MKIITLLSITIFSLYANSFYKNGATVTDPVHKLLWQDSKDNIILRGSQDSANKYCDSLTQNGHTNWRLPTKDEYQYIIDTTIKTEKPKINKAFHFILPTGYWTTSRTWMKNFGRYGYYVLFSSGSIYYENRSYKKFYRCVRDR